MGKRSQEDSLNKVKALLANETNNKFGTTRFTPYGPARPVYNKGCLELQFRGWMIVLTPEGTWFWDDTSGG